MSSKAIGVLDLQGDVVEHLDHLERLGISGLRVKEAADFADLAGLIIPGGESTCLFRLMNIFGIKEIILREFQRGLKLWGTCAGAILLAKNIAGEAPCLGLIDIEIRRNAFGSQLDSFMTEALVPRVAPQPIPLTFIRAPKIIRTGADVEVLLRQDDYIAAVESPNILVTVFHPELTPCLAFHRYFAIKCGLKPLKDEKLSLFDPTWNSKSWTRYVKVI